MRSHAPKADPAPGASSPRPKRRRWKPFAAQLIPADRDPGAKEAFVVNYIDIQLTRQFKKHQRAYRQGIAALDAASRAKSGKRFVELPPEAQVEALNALEESSPVILRVGPRPHPAGILRRPATRRQPQHGELENARSAVPAGARPAAYERAEGRVTHGPQTMSMRWLSERARAAAWWPRNSPRAGLSVVLLERGKWYSAADCRKDDLYNQRTQVLGAKFGPDDERNPRVLVDQDGRETIVIASDGGYSNNAACVGGGTFSYGAMAWRYMEKDFRMRSTYGAVEGSTLEDWPIGYSDLEPYYEKAEWELGVSGDDTNNIFKAPRKKPLPMPPLAPNKEYQILFPAAKRLGLHPFDIPMLRNTVPYNGRGSCMRCRWCVGFACEVNARTGTHNTVIPAALATGNCDLRTECMTKEILLDSRGRATGVAYFDAHGRLQHQPAGSGDRVRRRH